MNIFIAGLNYNMSEAELGELFAEYGEVVSVKKRSHLSMYEHHSLWY